MAAHSISGTARPLAVSVLLFAYFGFWAVLGRYWGLQHDAQHYAVQALAKLQPATLGGDLFLRFRSQDEYTLFPDLCAAVFRWLGVDAGAALLTLLAFAAWITVAGCLARRLVGSALAWLSIGLLVVAPGWYGAGKVFRTAEPFLSARTSAEALGIGALLLAVHKRHGLAILLTLVAGVLHPIMALPMLVVACVLWVPRHDTQAFRPATTVLLITGAIGAAFLFGWPEALMSQGWLDLTRSRSSYLFPRSWSTADWQVTIVPLLSALLSAQLLSDWSNRVAAGSVWIGGVGLALAAIADALSLTLLLQVQPWRWVWLAGVVSLVLLPSTVMSAWRSGSAGRAAALLTCTAWLLVNWSSGDRIPPIGASGLLLALAVGAWWLRDRFSTAASRSLLIGSMIMLAAAALGLASSIVAVLGGRFHFGTDPAWVEALADVLQMTGAAMLLVVLAWWLTVGSCSPAGVLAVALFAGALSIGAAPGAARTWRADQYSGPAHATFAEWRNRIPIDAEVFWPDGLQETWFLLGRRSYLSRSQLAGIVFSEDLACEARRRADVVAPLAPVGYWFYEAAPPLQPKRLLAVDTLARVCVLGGPDFVVAATDAGGATNRIEWPIRGRFAYLYDCRGLRMKSRPQPL